MDQGKPMNRIWYVIWKLPRQVRWALMWFSLTGAVMVYLLSAEALLGVAALVGGISAICVTAWAVETLVQWILHD